MAGEDRDLSRQRRRSEVITDAACRPKGFGGDTPRAARSEQRTCLPVACVGEQVWPAKRTPSLGHARPVLRIVPAAISLQLRAAERAKGHRAWIADGSSAELLHPEFDQGIAVRRWLVLLQARGTPGGCITLSSAHR